MFASPAHGGHLAAAAAELDCTSRVLCSSALSCIANYFSWAPLSCIFSSHLLSTLLQYATFGCQVNSSSHSTSEGEHWFDRWHFCGSFLITIRKLSSVWVDLTECGSIVMLSRLAETQMWFPDVMFLPSCVGVMALVPQSIFNLQMGQAIGCI